MHRRHFLIGSLLHTNT